VIWTFGIIIIILLCIVGLIALYLNAQFRKFRRELPQPLYKFPKLKPDVASWSDSDLSIAWIGHSSFYINFFGKHIVTDLVFSHRAGVKIGPWTIGITRHTAPALQARDLPPVDIVLLSHAHLDHFDIPSLRAVANAQAVAITPVGPGRLLRRMRFREIIELTHNASFERDGLKITPIPVRHWGRRFPWNKDYQWTGYLLTYKGVTVLFAGDTALTEEFRNIPDGVDIAFLPIGAYSPDTFQGSHCTPEQAWQMFLDARGKKFIPMHFDTFVLSRESVDEPLQRLLNIAGKRADDVVIREQGGIYKFLSEKK